MDTLLLFSLLFVLRSCLCEEKWRWQNNNRASRRYEVVEPAETIFGQNIKPPPPPSPPQNTYFPGPVKPIGQGGGFGSNYNPGPAGQPILTGPVPSWQRRPLLEKFDRCKCAESFNCNTPGISYGQCDVGKQYCCYRTGKSGIIGTPIPSRPVHSIQNGILVGPGGPVDIPPSLVHQQRPGLGGYAGRHEGSGYSVTNAALSSPGGPIDFKKRSTRSSSDSEEK